MYALPALVHTDSCVGRETLKKFNIDFISLFPVFLRKFEKMVLSR